MTLCHVWAGTETHQSCSPIERGACRAAGFGVVFSLWAVATLTASAVLAEPPPVPPSIVLIVADDLGYGDLGSYGARHHRTPHLDQIARDGTRFTSFTVAQPVCTASRAALLTGCYSNRVGMGGALNHTSPTGIHPDEVLLSDVLQKQGYATAIFGKWHLGHQPPFLPTRRGFQEWLGIPYSNDNGPLHPVTRGIPPLPWYDNEAVVQHDPDQSLFTQRLTDAAIEFIKNHRNRPVFVYLPHIMPHVPIFASESFQGRSGHGLYADVIEELDSAVGRLMTALRELKQDENTLVIFLSDNGPFLSYGEHAGSAGPLREGKLTTFEGGVRVPCLMRWPGQIPAGRVVSDLVSAIDLYPTLVALAGGTVPEGVRDGIDMSNLVKGRPGSCGRDTFWYYSGDELHAVRKGLWKLHAPHDYLTVAGQPGRGGKPSEFGRLTPRSIEESGISGIASRHGYRVERQELALYHLGDDPGEQNNRAAVEPDIVAELQLELERARADLGDSLSRRKPSRARPVGDVRHPSSLAPPAPRKPQ